MQQRSRTASPRPLHTISEDLLALRFFPDRPKSATYQTALEEMAYSRLPYDMLDTHYGTDDAPELAQRVLASFRALPRDWQADQKVRQAEQLLAADLPRAHEAIEHHFRFLEGDAWQNEHWASNKKDRAEGRRMGIPEAIIDKFQTPDPDEQAALHEIREMFVRAQGVLKTKGFALMRELVEHIGVDGPTP